MKTYGGTKPKKTAGEDRTRWPTYTDSERQSLDHKLLPPSNWESLDFLNDFWNVVHDEGDLTQYRRLANVWQMRNREPPTPFSRIGTALQFDKISACRMYSGKNFRPNLSQMYLNRERLGTPRKEGWKWILDCTPKPTDPYPRALQVPARVCDVHDILEFLEQFPSTRDDSEALRFFGLSSDWAKAHRAELFWFLMGFFVGDAGKQYVHNEYRARHYKKTAMTTRMTHKDSNFRVLRYVQLGLEQIGIPSHQVKSEDGVMRWNSVSSNAITWMMQCCIGLKEGQSTSNYPIDMPWMKNCPKNLITAFLQGLADSDGNVDKYGYHANISSVPNSIFYKNLFEIIGVKAHPYPKDKPQQVRILLRDACELPLFSPIIRSYRYEQLIQHAIRRKLIPPPPSFFLHRSF